MAWYAHQTHPDYYLKYTFSVLGRLLNNDDTIGSSDNLGMGRYMYVAVIKV